MSFQPREFNGDSGPIGGPDREVVSGEEIRRRVQAMIDNDPMLRECGKRVIAPMPKPRASETPTGCNWHMHYRGQFPDCEDRIDMIVEIVQQEVNIGGPVATLLS